MELKKVLEDTLSTDLEKAEDLIQNATVKITFWGAKKVTIQGCQDSVDLDWLTKKVLCVMPTNEDNLLTKAVGMNLGLKITLLETKTISMLLKKNVITRSLFTLRHLFSKSQFHMSLNLR